MSEPVIYSGKTKLEFCERLGPDWRRLAIYLNIPDSDQQGFGSGDEPREVWGWLERRQILSTLPEALQYIRRGDLLPLLEPETAAAKPSRPTWTGCP